jgi:hypothetical protein
LLRRAGRIPGLAGDRAQVDAPLPPWTSSGSALNAARADVMD